MKKLLLNLTMFASLSAFSQMQGFNVGDNAPDFTGTDLNGNSHSLSQYAGKYIILDLFAYWCGPCEDVAPIFNDFYVKYGCNTGNVIALGVEYEGTDAQIHEFEQRAGTANRPNPTPTIGGQSGGGGAIIQAYNPAGFPTTAIIGPDGKIVATDVWPISSVSDLENAFPSGVLTPKSCTVSAPSATITPTFETFPNPASDQLNINWFNIDVNDEITIEVFDLNGRLIKKEEIEETSNTEKITLNITTLTKGTYIVRFSTTSGTVINKKVSIL